MCGIAGIYNHNNNSDIVGVLNKMNTAMSHRGPDDQGTYTDEMVGLAHRRLAIIDLSAAGHQPMRSHDGDLEVVFNGEIYNFREIKKELTDSTFVSESDTEVILEAYKKWGVKCVEKFNGMFALAIWNKKDQSLFIARDRLGIKPLYYARVNNSLVFASEIRSLLASGMVSATINHTALTDYFTYQTVHAPNTLLKDVFMLLPGHYMKAENNSVTVHEYWNLIGNSSNKAATQSYEDVCEEIRTLFYNSIKRRLISDVPFGAFLSGGIDSSAVVGYMSKILDSPVKTFHISFDESEFSEALYAKIISKKFGTEHHEFRLTPNDFLQKLPDALQALDHPSGDGPNSWLVSRITRENGITMALSGLGGDELFAGYPIFNHSMLLNQMSFLWKIPVKYRLMLAHLLAKGKPGMNSNKLEALAKLPSCKLIDTIPLSRQLINRHNVSKLLSGKIEIDSLKAMIVDGYESGLDKLPALSQISYSEISGYMQNILLRDTDQMSMASALEVRVPFLDHTLVEYVMGIKDSMKKPVTPKKLFTDSMKGLLPDEVVYRKKMGFTFPWAQWLRNELRPFCEERIYSLANRDFMNKDVLISRWKAFCEGGNTVRWPEIWIAVVLEEWMMRNNVQN